MATIKLPLTSFTFSLLFNLSNWDRKRNEEVLQELNIIPTIDYIHKYQKDDKKPQHPDIQIGLFQLVQEKWVEGELSIFNRHFVDSSGSDGNGNKPLMCAASDEVRARQWRERERVAVRYSSGRKCAMWRIRSTSVILRDRRQLTY
ncbi:hypothetical protein C0J52_13677 [Blattella germanica]|nr:hypothetical protein C0J52_13677 [Blattella germanica]